MMGFAKLCDDCFARTDNGRSYRHMKRQNTHHKACPLCGDLGTEVILLDREMIMKGHYNSLSQIFYKESDNIFYTIDGQKIVELFKMIRPIDLYLFKIDPGHCMFPHITEHGVLIEILTED